MRSTVDQAVQQVMRSTVDQAVQQVMRSTVDQLARCHPTRRQQACPFRAAVWEENAHMREGLNAGCLTWQSREHSYVSHPGASVAKAAPFPYSARTPYATALSGIKRFGQVARSSCARLDCGTAVVGGSWSKQVGSTPCTQPPQCCTESGPERGFKNPEPSWTAGQGPIISWLLPGHLEAAAGDQAENGKRSKIRAELLLAGSTEVG
jgi:hypothetical protein